MKWMKKMQNMQNKKKVSQHFISLVASGVLEYFREANLSHLETIGECTQMTELNIQIIGLSWYFYFLNTYQAKPAKANLLNQTQNTQTKQTNINLLLHIRVFMQ